MADSPPLTPDPAYVPAGETGSTARPQESSPADTLKSSRDKAFQEAKTRVREAADAQRQRAADAVGGVAGALHRAAGDLNSENQTMGRYTDMAAERLDGVAQYLRTAEWNSVIEGAEDFARRQPAWFIGGALAAGFLVARAVKNSGPPRERDAVTRFGRGIAASSTAGYGTGTAEGVEAPGSAATRPISPSAAPPYPGAEG